MRLTCGDTPGEPLIEGCTCVQRSLNWIENSNFEQLCAHYLLAVWCTRYLCACHGQRVLYFNNCFSYNLGGGVKYLSNPHWGLRAETRSCLSHTTQGQAKFCDSTRSSDAPIEARKMLQVRPRATRSGEAVDRVTLACAPLLPPVPAR
jgi:hypothetical protein